MNKRDLNIKTKILKNNINKIADNNYKSSESFNKQYYYQIPKKYYKYREFEDYNLEAIKNDYIWISKACNFMDEFDSTVKFDLKKDIEPMNEVVVEELSKIIKNDLKEVLRKKGYKKAQLSQIEGFDLKSFLEEHTFKNGRFKKEKTMETLKLIGVNKKESRVMFSKIKKMYSDEYLDKFVKDLFKQLEKANNKLREITYVHSFATNKEHRYLWERYTDNDKGFCLEYDISLLKKIGFDKFKDLYALVPILYQDKPKINMPLIIKKAIEVERGKVNEISDKILYKELMISLLTKHPQYSIEGEWRLIFIEMEKLENKYHFPFLNAIYLGSKVTNENKTKIINIAKEKNINVYQRTVNKITNEYEFIECYIPNK